MPTTNTQKRIKHYQNEMQNCKAILKWFLDLVCKKKKVVEKIIHPPKKKIDFTMCFTVSGSLNS